MIAAKIIEQEDEIAARLMIPASSKMIKIERVRHTSEEPFALETCYLEAERFPGLVREALGRGSLFARLEQDYGVQLTYADEEVDATAADLRIAQFLQVPRGAPVMRIRQVIYLLERQAGDIRGGFLSCRTPFLVHPPLPIIDRGEYPHLRPAPVQPIASKKHSA